MPQALRKSTQQVPSNQTPGGDLQTGVRNANSPVKGAEPLRGSSWRGSCTCTRKKHKGVTGHLYQDNPNSTWNRHRRSRAANLSQPGAEPQKGSQLHDTERKNRRWPRTSWTDTPRSPSKSLRHPQKKQHRGYRKKNPKHKDRNHQRMWPAAKTPKASNRRRERRIDRQSKKGNTKSEA